MAESRDFSSGDDSSLGRLLQCPVCLEQFRQPKSLPCLHSFCEECLGTCITQHLSGDTAAGTTFPCPVCRRETSPYNPDVRKEMWAQQFPTNNHVKKLIDLQSTTGTVNPLCGPCQTTNNVQKKADVWCSATNTFFCDACKSSFHDVIHKDCEIVAVSEDSVKMAQKQPSPMVCQTHKERMDCFCEDHKFIGCNKCIITEHRRCDSVTTTKEYFNKQKSNSNIQNMNKSLVEAVNSMDFMVKSFNDKEQNMQQSKLLELNSISTLRNRIIAYLDKRQAILIQELNSSYKTELGKVALSKQRCNRLRTAMLISKEALQMAVKREDDVDTIRLLLRGQTEARACRDLLEDFSRSLTSVHIKHDIGSDFHILNENSTLSLGTILIERKPQNLPYGIRFVKTLSSCRAKKLRSISIDNIRGSGKVAIKKFGRSHGAQRVVLLSNVLVVGFTDQSYLQLLTVGGQCLYQLQTQGLPQDMCVVDATTVAVSLCDNIQLVSVQNSQLRSLHIIQTTSRCYGIAYVNETFMVSTPRGISMVNRNGNAFKVHSLEKDCYSIAYDSLYQQAFATLSDHQDVNKSYDCTPLFQHTGYESPDSEEKMRHMRREDVSIYKDYPHEYDDMDKGARSRKLTAETPVLISLMEQAVDSSDHQNVNTSYGRTPLSLFQHTDYENVSSRQNQKPSVPKRLMKQAVNTSCRAVPVTMSPARDRRTKIIQNTILNVGVVKHATGVTVDREGNVYVCDDVSNNVVQISADGSKVREILTSEDDINSPTAISLCGDKFVVASQTLHKENKIDVFQLF